VAPLVVDGPHRGRVILGRLAAAGSSRRSTARTSPLLATEEEGPNAHLSPLRKHDPARGGRTSIIVFGPSGSGKTSGLAIPAILEWDGPVLALSVKDDLLAKTIQHRRSLGEVKVFDPTAVLAPKITTSCWSPLRRCKTLAGANKVAGGLTETPSSSDDLNSKFFRDLGISLLGPYLFAARQAGLGMGDVARWCAVQDGVIPEGKHKADSECAAILEALAAPSTAAASATAAAATAQAKAVSAQAVATAATKEATAAGIAYQADPTRATSEALGKAESAQALALHIAEAAQDAADKAKTAAEAAKAAVTVLSEDATIALRSATAVWKLYSATRDGAFANASVGVAAWASAQVAASAERDEISLRWLMTGTARTLYAVAPADHQEGLQPVFGGMIQEIFDDAFAAASHFGGELPHRLLIVLDEAANICPLKSLPRYASTVRSVGITLITMFQSEAQVIERWKASSDTVVENHVTKMVLSGVSDPKTLNRFSALVGDTEVEKTSESTASDDRKSSTTSSQRERLLPMDIIRRLPPGDALMFTGSLLPAHLHLRQWWRDPVLKDLAEPPPLTAEVVRPERPVVRPLGLTAGPPPPPEPESQ
jgi:type IV secretion system protein VirD4